MPEPLTAEEEAALRAEATAEQGYPGKHGQWERLVLRLLATLDAARVDPDGLLREVVEEYLIHSDLREPYTRDITPGDGRHFDGDGCFDAMSRAALSERGSEP